MKTTPKKRTPAAKPNAFHVSDQLRAVIRDRGLNAHAVAVLAEVDPPSMLRFLKGQRGLNLATFDKVCAALGLRLIEAQRTRRLPAKPAVKAETAPLPVQPEPEA